MKEETIKIFCDNCKQEIENIYTHYPVEVRYWHCEPVFCEHAKDGVIFAVMMTTPEPKDYCIKCWNEIHSIMEEEEEEEKNKKK